VFNSLQSARRKHIEALLKHSVERVEKLAKYKEFLEEEITVIESEFVEKSCSAATEEKFPKNLSKDSF
jgi:hypothetical protein